MQTETFLSTEKRWSVCVCVVCVCEVVLREKINSSNLYPGVPQIAPCINVGAKMLIRDKKFYIWGIIYTSMCRHKIPRLEKHFVDD